MIAHPRAAPLPAAPRAGTATAEALADALRSERRLLDELVSIMRLQRSAVAADDLQGVDDSVFATHRVLLTLGEARRRRRSLTELLGEPEEVTGLPPGTPLQEAREGLRAAALVLSREVEVNRRVLREALAAGNDYVRTLCGAPEPAGGDVGRGGLLLDRTA